MLFNSVISFRFYSRKIEDSFSSFEVSHFKTLIQFELKVYNLFRIIKVGVGILNDVRQLWRDYQIEVKGCLDLQPLAMKYNLADNGTGLSSLCWTTLEAELQKSHIVQVFHSKAIFQMTL